MAFDLGDVVPLTVAITNASSAPTNATTVTLTITLPDGTTTSPSITNPPATTGTYLYDYLTTMPGRHSARWTSSGPAAAHADEFDVRPANPGYVISLADAKQQLNMTTTANDEELRFYIEATTAIVEQLRGETIAFRTFTEEREIRTGRFPLAHTPVVSLTSVATVDGFITWDVSRLHVSPAGVVAPNPYVNTGLLDLKGWIKAVYTAGYQIVPANVGLAARIIIQHLWQTQRPERGSGNRNSALGESVVPGMGFAVPNRALELLGNGVPGFA